MLKYINTETNELILPTRELAKKVHIRHDNLKNRQLKALIELGLIKEGKINKKYLDKH